MIVFIGMGLLMGGLLGARFSVGALIPAAAMIIGAAALGIVSDRLGRKRTIVIGCIVLALFSFLTMYATDLTTLRLLRIG